MPLGFDQLLKLVRENNLMENLSSRELENPEGTGFDLRVGEVYELGDEGFLGVEERKTSKVKLVAQYGKEKDYLLKKGDYVLFRTIEKINLPLYLSALPFPRSTLFRSGVLFLGTQISPGYQGKLIFGLKNLGNYDFRFQLGARLAHILFYRVEGESSPYRGQWQGGRVAAEKREKQI